MEKLRFKNKGDILRWLETATEKEKKQAKALWNYTLNRLRKANAARQAESEGVQNADNIENQTVAGRHNN